jgi:Zn-dependent protease
VIASSSGSIRLFRLAGIQVYLHWWSWLLVAWFQISQRGNTYSSVGWMIAEYVALFGIVLMHEFGHSFASRQVGGESREILLWPFGGIAFVKVPPRPGAHLWSIAAGPLVNVALFPVLMLAVGLSGSLGWSQRVPDFGRFLFMLFLINKWLLIFNLLPIYPLDGGQIFRALLWFRLGAPRSLQIATIVGFIGVAALIVRAILLQSLFSGAIAAFLGMECYRSYKQAKAQFALQRLPRHAGFACPACHEPPPGGPIWLCGNCRNGFDTFSTRAVCPHCSALHPQTTCVFCGSAHPIAEWEAARRPAAEPPVIDI